MSLVKRDWERATLRAIARGGLAAIHIDELATELGVTKGSFYWHFDSRDALIERALETWRDDSLSQLATVSALPTPRAQLNGLLEACVFQSKLAVVEVALSGVVDDERITHFVEQITEARLAAIVSALMALDVADAQSRAVACHAMLIGYLHTVRVAPLRSLKRRSVLALWMALTGPS